MAEILDGEHVDITPAKIGGPKKEDMKIIFQETELENIKENPSGLTKEGVEKKIEIWKNSSNRYVLTKYKAMLHNCKKLGKSGKTSDGLIIYGRKKDGTVWWTQDPTELKIPQGTAKKKV